MEVSEIKISTVITSFNRKHCIEIAVESARNEMPDHEIVIIDDASTDGTPEFIRERFSNEISEESVKLFCLEENIGVSGAKNYGYEMASGYWVVFLDSDDHYIKDSGQLIASELGKSHGFPIVFFRCETEDGQFVGEHAGVGMQLNLETYLKYTSFGEALTAVNKELTGIEPPYWQSLRGYEGIGCAGLIQRFGPAYLSDIVARVYVISGGDRLSVSSGLFLRMPLLAKGHVQMIRQFSRHMSLGQIVSLAAKAFIYYVLGYSYRIFAKR